VLLQQLTVDAYLSHSVCVRRRVSSSSPAKDGESPTRLRPGKLDQAGVEVVWIRINERGDAESSWWMIDRKEWIPKVKSFAWGNCSFDLRDLNGRCCANLNAAIASSHRQSE